MGGSKAKTKTKTHEHDLHPDKGEREHVHVRKHEHDHEHDHGVKRRKSTMREEWNDGHQHHHQSQASEVEGHPPLSEHHAAVVSSKEHSIKKIEKSGELSSSSSQSSRILAASNLDSSNSNNNNKNNGHPYFYYQNNTASNSNSPHPHNFLLHSHPNTIHPANIHNNNANTLNTLYQNYGTTLTLLIFLHIIYLYQWNKRRSRRDVCTSYDQLVVKKQFYKAVIALASHPPVDGGERDTNFFISNRSNNSRGALNVVVGDGQNPSDGGAAGGGGPIQRRGMFQRFLHCNCISTRLSPTLSRIRPLYQFLYQKIIHPLVYGSLSGLPLLAFASHILWQCRALEDLYDEYDGKLILGVVPDSNVNVTHFPGIGTHVMKLSADMQNQQQQQYMESASSLHEEGYAYFRVLLALSVTSILLELSLLRSMLKRIDVYVNFDGYTTTPASLLRQRAMCSIASLCTALLDVYEAHFPYAPPPVVPFVRLELLNSSGFSMIIMIFILALLTHRIHPVTSIISGLLSGSLWSLGWTSFLGTKYWGNVLLGSLGFGMVLSMKAQPELARYCEIFIPCIDYVGWDMEGEFPNNGSALNNSTSLLRRQSSGSMGHRRLSRSNSNMSDDDEDNDDHGGDVEMGGSSSRYPTQNGIHGSTPTSSNEERFPLLSAQYSSMSNHSAIRGRVPLMNSMDSDIMDGADDSDLVTQSNESSVPAASSRFGGASLSRRGGGGLGNNNTQ